MPRKGRKVANLITSGDDPTSVITGSTLNTTKAALLGAVLVAFITPVAAYVGGLNDPVKQMALTVTAITIPSVAVVFAVDAIARAYATVGKLHYGAGAAGGTGASAEVAGAPLASGSVALFGPGIQVHSHAHVGKVLHVLGCRWDGAMKQWQYWLAGDGVLEWANEADLADLVSYGPPG